MANGNGGYEDEEGGMSVASAADLSTTAPKSESAKKKNKNKKPKGKNKKPVGTPKDPPRKRKGSVPRHGLTAEEYYVKECEAVGKKYQEKFAKAKTQKARDNAKAEFDRGLEAAKKRRGLPTRKPKTVADKKEETLIDGENAWRKKYDDQTDQNYIALNMLAFSKLDQKPKPSQLPNLMLVSDYKGNLINKLTASSKLEPLMRATPFELSQLTPFFRIFKRDEGGLHEFQFMDHLKWSYSTRGTGEDGTPLPPVEHVLNSSLGQGVGFKSFDWETTGTNLFSAPRTLMATLNLHFQSISELARSARLDEEYSVKWLDLIVPQGGKNSIARGCPTGIPEVDALLKTTLTYEEVKKYEQDPSFRSKVDAQFALMVEVGWKYASNSTLSPEFRTAVDGSRLVLDLTLVSHNFKFREEGTIDLEISYMARLEGIMNDYSANLFNLTSDGKSNEIQKQLEEKKQQIKTMEHAIDSPYGLFNCAEDETNTSSQTKGLDAKAEKLGEEIDKLQDEADALTKRLKVSIYGKFTEYMIKNEKLMYIDVPDELYAYGALPFVGKPNLVCGVSKATPPNPNADLTAPSAANVELISTIPTDGDEEDKEVDGKKLLSQITPMLGSTQAWMRGNKRINFFYLGTLINFYAGVLPISDSSANEVDKFEIVLGDMVFLNYKEIGRKHNRELQDVEEMEGTDAQKSAVAASNAKKLDEDRQAIVSNADFRVTRNLAHIPISLEAFTMWFTDEVINGDSVFTFKKFVRSLTTKLLVGSLQAADNHYVNENLRRVLKERTQVKAGVVSGVNRYLKKSQLNVEGKDPATGESTLLVKGISPWTQQPGMTEEQRDNITNKQYFVLYVSRLPFASQEVDEAKNAEEGIYHLYIGGDKGLVKTINLEKEANNRIRDANIMRAYNVGGGGLGIIQEPYNATVRLFGSGFFQPGQYVYINPTNIGLGTQHERYSIARKLGLGGFYLVTKVNTTISEGKLETNLRCIFQNYGFLEPPPGRSDSTQEQGERGESTEARVDDAP
jgi:hypothetical protein